MEGVKLSDRPKTSYRDNCSVPGCNSNAKKDLLISLHRFPKPNECIVKLTNFFGKVEKVDKLKAWKIAVKLNKITTKKRVCSLHFNKEDFILPDVYSKKRRLKKTAVPSQNLPRRSGEFPVSDNRLKRRLRRGKKEKYISTGVWDITPAVNQLLIPENVLVAEKSEPAQGRSEIIIDLIQQSTEAPIYDNHAFLQAQLAKEIGVQVTSGDFIFEFKNLIKNERDLSTATGINSFQVLQSIVEMVQMAFGNTSKHQNTKMSLHDRILMTYVKLKQNLSYSFLALLFHCYTNTHCRRIFLETLNMLSETLQVAVTWPSKNEILKNMPSCFEGFEDVRVVIDCTEIFIQEPKNLCCQIITHSNYKKARTAKIMTGVAPDGSITYISKAWGGRTSDQKIFEKSSIINLLEPGDSIMVDKGFGIDEICAKNKWKLIRPPFLSDKKQFSQAESQMTAKIAKARVHVERSNQRIKTFKIVGDTMPVKLVPYVDQIFLVVCSTVNLCDPILKDDKFMKRPSHS